MHSSIVKLNALPMCTDVGVAMQSWPYKHHTLLLSEYRASWREGKVSNAIVLSLQPETLKDDNKKCSPYSTEHTVILLLISAVDAVCKDNYCYIRGSYETHKCTLWAKCTAGRSYCNHFAWKNERAVAYNPNKVHLLWGAYCINIRVSIPY